MPCKIEKDTEHRTITVEEFQRQKGYGDYKKFRQVAKAEKNVYQGEFYEKR